MCTPHSSNQFTTFVQKAAKACLLKPIVGRQLEPRRSTEEAQCTLDGMASEGSSDVSVVSREMADWRVDSQEASSPGTRDVEKLALKVKALESLLCETFATVSCLKEAYFHMQSAHSPYHPDKLYLADKAIVLELKKLSELKQNFRWKHGNGNASWDGCRQAHPELEEKHRSCGISEGSSSSSVRSLKLELHKKGAEIDNLKDTVQRLVSKKEKLERRVKKMERRSMRDVGATGSHELSPTVQLFESAVYGAKESARSFTKLLTSYMKTANWDLDAAVNSIEPGVVYAKQSHKKYAFQSYVCLRMFSGFENENFYISGSLSSILDPEKHRHDCFSQFQDMQYMDPLELVCITPDCLFGKFCHKKFLHIVHPKMEESFFGNFEHRNHIVNGAHPRSQFYEVFLKFAKAVWLVHKLAFSFDPTASIFQVRKGADFSAAYMENVVQNVEMESDTLNLLPKVGFTLMPGFRIGKATLRCQIYLNGMKSSQ